MDGATYSVERKNAPERLIKNARLTLSLQVQSVVINRYIERKGDIAKGIGFLLVHLFVVPFPHKDIDK